MHVVAGLAAWPCQHMEGRRVEGRKGGARGRQPLCATCGLAGMGGCQGVAVRNWVGSRRLKPCPTRQVCPRCASAGQRHCSGSMTHGGPRVPRCPFRIGIGWIGVQARPAALQPSPRLSAWRSTPWEPQDAGRDGQRAHPGAAEAPGGRPGAAPPGLHAPPAWRPGGAPGPGAPLGAGSTPAAVAGGSRGGTGPGFWPGGRRPPNTAPRVAHRSLR